MTSDVASPLEKPSNELIAKLTSTDTFLLSTSEFVTPAIPISYIKNKGTYLLFRTPKTSISLVPSMALWFKVTAFALNAEVSFKGEVYKLFGEGETSYPCIVIKAPGTMTLTPMAIEQGLTGIDLPVVWRKTGAMKRGTLKRLSANSGVFETPEDSLRSGESFMIQINLPNGQTDELPATVKSETPIEEGGNFLALTVEFSFGDLTPPQQGALQKGIGEIKADKKRSSRS